MRFTILVADDEKNIREGLAEALGMDGYETRTAADGAEAIREVERGDIDLVITDLRMPAKSGTEVLKTVVGRYPGLPVIVLTGHGTIEDAVTAMRTSSSSDETESVSRPPPGIAARAFFTRLRIACFM